MNKKMKYLCRFLLAFGCLTISTKITATENMFDDLFKGFDFDAFLKDMEKAYDEDAEHKTFGPAAPKTGAKALDSIDAPITSKTPVKTTKSIEELFLSPITQKIQEKGKPAKTTISRESRDAFKEVMHEFITLLNAVTTKIEDSRIFSMPFKEQFLQYNDAIDKIAITYGTLVNKKMYALIMPFKQEQEPIGPQKTGYKAKTVIPQEAENLRQNILDAIKELRKINKELTAALKDEETDFDEPILKALSKKPRTKITLTHTPISKSAARNRRGSHDKKQHTQPAKKKAKKDSVKKVNKTLPVEAL